MAGLEKWSKYRKADAKEKRDYGRTALGLGAFLLIAGLLLAVFTKTDYDDFSSSDDIRKVEAVITDVTYVPDKQNTTDNEERWKVEYSYTVEGVEYTGDDSFYHEIVPGDTMTITVYRAKDGSYRKPMNVKKSSAALNGILGALMALGGLALAGWGGYTLYCSVMIEKALAEKKKERGK